MTDRVYLPGTIRERIQDLLKERGVTQAQLAEQIGSTDSTLSRFISGKTDKFSDENIINIAKFFCVSTDFLLGETDVPDRYNYDIGELGLSAQSARNLYTRKVNAEIINRMLENPQFPQLTQMIAQYFHDTFSAGISAKNQIMDMMNNYMRTYAQGNPSLQGGLSAVSTILERMKVDPQELELEQIHKAFLTILRQIKADIDAEKPVTENATKKIVADVMTHEEKGSEQLSGKPIVTVQQVGSALANATGAFPGQAEKFTVLIQNFLRDFSELAKEGLNEGSHDDQKNL